MTDLEALKHTIETGKTVPPPGCHACYYYNDKHKHICKLFESKKQVSLCVKNNCAAGIRSVYLKLIE